MYVDSLPWLCFHLWKPLREVAPLLVFSGVCGALTSCSPLSDHGLLPPTLFSCRLCRIPKLCQRGSHCLALNEEVDYISSPLYYGWYECLWSPSTPVWSKGECGISEIIFCLTFTSMLQFSRGEGGNITQCKEMCWEAHGGLKTQLTLMNI